MFRTEDGRVYRNLESQVEFLTEKVAAHWNVDRIIAEFGIRVVGSAETAAGLPDAETYTGEYGDTYLVGSAAPYDAYIFTRPFEGQDAPQWFNIGQLTIQGEAGLPGRRGSYWFTGTTAPTGTTMSGVQVLTYDMYLNTSNGNVYQYNGSNWALAGNIKGPAGSGGSGGGGGLTKYGWVDGSQATEAQQGNAIFAYVSMYGDIGFESGDSGSFSLNTLMIRDPEGEGVGFVADNLIQHVTDSGMVLSFEHLSIYQSGDEWYLDGNVIAPGDDTYNYGFFNSTNITQVYYLTTTT